MLLSWLVRRDTLPEPDPLVLMQGYIQTDNQMYLAQLIQCYGNDLYHFLLKQSDPVMAADISQQSWLKVMEQKQQFAGHSSFKTWLFAIGRNLLLDEFRKQKRWLYQVDEELVTEQAGPAQLVEQQQNEMQFQQLVQQLPLLQREALVLQLEGFSLQQIAQITCAEAETVKSRLRYARQVLAKQLESKMSDPNKKLDKKLSNHYARLTLAKQLESKMNNPGNKLDKKLQQWFQQSKADHPMPASLQQQLLQLKPKPNKTQWRFVWPTMQGLAASAALVWLAQQLWWQPDYYHIVVQPDKTYHQVQLHSLAKTETAVAQTAYQQRYQQYQHARQQLEQSNSLVGQLSFIKEQWQIEVCDGLLVKIEQQLALELQQDKPWQHGQWVELKTGQQGQILAVYSGGQALHCSS